MAYCPDIIVHLSTSLNRFPECIEGVGGVA